MSRALERRLEDLERQAGGGDTVLITGVFLRPDGSQYERRYWANRADVAYSAAEFEAKVRERAAQLEGQGIDIATSSIMDLLATQHYAAVIERIDTWFTWTSEDMPDGFSWLADELRRHLAAEGYDDDTAD